MGAGMLLLSVFHTLDVFTAAAALGLGGLGLEVLGALGASGGDAVPWAESASLGLGRLWFSFCASKSLRFGAWAWAWAWASARAAWCVDFAASATRWESASRSESSASWYFTPPRNSSQYNGSQFCGAKRRSLRLLPATNPRGL